MTAGREIDVIVAGHICVDITPLFERPVPDWFLPGSLHRVGPAVFANGGAVANTGLALHRFGNRVAAVGKVGADELGGICRQYMARFGLDGEIRAAEGLTTSYSVVVAPPGNDRFFLHHPGANEHFTAEDLDDRLLERAHLLHLGYPTLMAGLYRNGGEETYRILARSKEHGLMTSLDMQLMDPGSEAAAQDWPAILRRVAPALDFFLPSFEEVYEMLDLRGFVAARDEAARRGLKLEESVSPDKVRELAGALRGMGLGVVGVKCGLRGIYLATGRDLPGLPAAWRGRELWAAALAMPRVVSANGAGDCAIAGFLTAVRRGLGPEDALAAACVAGGQNVRAADTFSGLGDWAEVQAMMGSGQPRQAWHPGNGWREAGRPGVWRGPGDGPA